MTKGVRVGVSRSGGKVGTNSVGEGVYVAVNVALGVKVRVAVGVWVGVVVAVAVRVGVGVRLRVGVGVGLGVSVRVRVGVGVAVRLGVRVGAMLAVMVRVAVVVRVGLAIKGALVFGSGVLRGGSVGLSVGCCVGVSGMAEGASVAVGLGGKSVGRVGVSAMLFWGVALAACPTWVGAASARWLSASTTPKTNANANIPIATSATTTSLPASRRMRFNHL